MTTEPDPPEPDLPEHDLHVTFHDRLQPKATAGIYTIRVEHTLTEDGTDITAGDPLPDVEEQFEIRAVRFVLDESSVHAVYPAAGACGNFTRTLPHLTLNRAILPWERVLLGRSEEARPPWLALLVFGAGELPDDLNALGLTGSRTVAELRTPVDPGVLGPDLSDKGLDPAGPCHTIDVPAALFTATVPREDELCYLAHVRDVSTAGQRRDDGEVLTEGRYAVLTANRFPRTAGPYAVHLVSLEGFKDRLGPGQLPEGTRAVRLCALKSWSFTSDPKGELDAAGLLRGLAAPGRRDPESLALRLAPPPVSGEPGAPEAYARERLRLGYVPVPYRVLSGEQTYAWYRGPFTPVAAPPVPVVGRSGPHTTADHALIYEPEHGLFDVSYAAAWTLGRTLALSDSTYAEEITRARRELANQATEMMAVAGDPRLASLDPGELHGHALAELAEPGAGQAVADALAAPQVPGTATPAPSVRRARAMRADARASLHDERRREALRTTAARSTPTLPGRLDELMLLKQVPFAYLVPHRAMLPAESLRLFRIDPAWIEALLAGARDVGVHTSLDAHVDAELSAAVSRARSTAAPRAGLLISSALVRAWPAFDLIATAGGRPVDELRRDHVAPDVLLCLFDAVPDEIVIREPGQGIHFGIDRGADEDVVDDGGRIALRDLTPGDRLGFPLERDFPATGTVFDNHLREVGTGRADVLELHGPRGLVPALAGEFEGLTDLSPAQFALQLVNSPVEQRFTVTANPAATHREDRP
ncbi:hypothetical protein RM550_01555 [Streptomyces sp. DSM 41527]|uniref:Uncharacterized protein n=1 Tax=Streptomyces mooreae TaxID=3075523 RepID=A0ABU2T2K5_9ACTN|nr:hypothetical protein [Streptomyces sp. DSM 41527]MDT0454425.1 hypothetical protein [Streptomyces sp. DSM 41527]